MKPIRKERFSLLPTYTITCILVYLLLQNLPLFHIGRTFHALPSCSETLLHQSLSLSSSAVSLLNYSYLYINMLSILQETSSTFSAHYFPNSLLCSKTQKSYLSSQLGSMNLQNILPLQKFSLCPFLVIPPSKGNHYSDFRYSLVFLVIHQLCLILNFI